jgi:hypothetical protein
MRDYRIYLLNDEGRIVASHEFQGPDDQSALDAALAYCDDQAVEVWQGARRVGRFTKGCEPA